MSSECCESKQDVLEEVGRGHRQVLWIALVLNAGMFLLEQVYSWLVHSTSLQSDAMDMFADAFAYSLTILALNRGLKTKTRAALWKGYSLFLLGLIVLASSSYRAWHGIVPAGETISLIGGMALAAHLVCAWMLF